MHGSRPISDYLATNEPTKWRRRGSNGGKEASCGEEGLKQEWWRMREQERKVHGAGMGRVMRWNRKALVNYTSCRAGK